MKAIPKVKKMPVVILVLEDMVHATKSISVKLGRMRKNNARTRCGRGRLFMESAINARANSGAFNGIK